MIREVEGVTLDLEGLRILPGLVNAHDHLEFALFPRLGNRVYPNAREWALDIHHPDRSPIKEHLRVPKDVRLIWGGLRNLLAGVTLVAHHNPYESIFDGDFPVTVLRRYGWAHSFAFADDLSAAFAATPAGAPFLIHLGEGTDQESADEIFRLHNAGLLNAQTVLIHATGLTAEGWQLVESTGASVIWCPQSNLFTLGQTLKPSMLPPGVRIALGTDSPLTSCGDLLDELEAAKIEDRPIERLCPMVTESARAILYAPPDPATWIATPCFGAPPELVVLRGRIALISPRLFSDSLREAFYPLHLEGRPEVLVRWNIPHLIHQAEEHIDQLTLGGRRVLA